MRRRVAFIAAVTAAVLLAMLGMWQLERRAWKLDLIARVETRIAAPPAALPDRSRWDAIGKDDAYRHVRADGRWIAAPPVFVKAVTSLGGGSWVMAPLSARRGIVLVNRGFVPDDARDRIVPASGDTIVTGLLRTSEPGGAFLRSNDPAHDRWFSRDVAAIARARGLRAVAPFFIDADAGTGRGWPRGGMTVVRFPNNHLIYALTWFALAGLAAWFAWRIAREERG